MSPFWEYVLGSSASLAIFGGMLTFIEWKEKRDARRHQLDLERVRKEREIADLKEQIERLKGGAK